MGTVFFEILIIIIFPPLKLIARIFGKGVHGHVKRVEDAVIREVHAMGAEARTIHEIEMNASNKAYLAGGAIDHSRHMTKDTLDSTERARRTIGADLSLEQKSTPGQEILQRGPKRVEAINSDAPRSDQMKEAMLEAQRLREARQQRNNRNRRR